MRLEEHLTFSTAAALLALPWLKEDVWLPYAASLLIDGDHYLWYVVTQRRLDPREALRYFRRPQARRGPLAKPLHHPLVLTLLALLALSTHSRRLWLVLAGLVFHVSLDAFNNQKVRGIQRQLQREAGERCPRCGLPTPRLELHALRPVRTLLARYQRANYVVLCPACHRELHRRPRGSAPAAGALPESRSASSLTFPLDERPAL
jgi:hypothetical protein